MKIATIANEIVGKNIFKYNNRPKTLSPPRKIALILAGLFIGAINGLLGAGGGMLTVPALTFIAGLDEKSAHATAIAVILPLCLISSIVYSVGSNFDVTIVLPTVTGVTLGGILGALLLKKLSGDAVSFIFYALMIFAGLKMLV